MSTSADKSFILGSTLAFNQRVFLRGVFGQLTTQRSNSPLAHFQSNLNQRNVFAHDGKTVLKET